jgi:microcystin-dependent protein
MADPFVAEIRIFPFNFAPKSWAFCNGQLLPLSQNTALFSLLGTTYGGNGTSNFALPNLQGNAPMEQGQGPGLTLRDLGETGGSQTVTIIDSEMPAHSHTFNANNGAGQNPNPGGEYFAEGVWLSGNNRNTVQMYTTNAPNVMMNPMAVSPAGSGLPHNNMMPYLTLNFCIALSGVYPPRT